MNGLFTYELALTLAAEREQTVVADVAAARMMTQAGLDHPLRRRISTALIHLGVRLSPQHIEFGPKVRTTQPGC